MEILDENNGPVEAMTIVDPKVLDKIKGPEEVFTGDVQLAMVLQNEDPLIAKIKETLTELGIDLDQSIPEQK